MRRYLASVLLVLSCLLVTVQAAAQSVRALADQLKNNSDYRVRTQAALALGASGDAAAVQPLCDGLGDSNVNVKLAAAAALGKLGNPSGVRCLQAADARESAANVKSAIQRSIGQLQGGGGGVASGAKYYVAIQVTNKTPRSAGEIEGIVRGAMQAKLTSASGYAVAPKTETPAQGGQIIKSKNMKGFLLLATVEAPVYAGGAVKQVLRLAMFSYPDKALRGEVSQKAETDANGKDVGAENDLMKACAESGVANFQKIINTL